MSAAAGVLLLLAGTLYFTDLLVREHHYATGYGEIEHVRLQDGSVVVLNANSRLTYRRSLRPGAPREVQLDGEAYFDVRQLAGGVPFRVHAGDVRLEVLGTTFNVNNRRGRTLVVLESGEVQLRHEAQRDTLLMRPGELAEYAPEQHAFVKRAIDPARYVSWIEQRFIFDETPVGEIARLIEDRYGVQVELRGEALRGRTLTGEVVAEDLDFLLEVVRASLDIRIRREGNRLTLEDTTKRAP